MREMVDNWISVSIPKEIYDKAKEYYETHEEELRLKNGIRSFTGYIAFCVRKTLIEMGAI